MEIFKEFGIENEAASEVALDDSVFGGAVAKDLETGEAITVLDVM